MRRLLSIIVLVFIIVFVLKIEACSPVGGGFLMRPNKPRVLETMRENISVEVEKTEEEETRLEIKMEVPIPTVEEVIDPIFTHDVFQISNLTEDDFNTMLEGYPLAGLGHVFVQIEEEYGVNGLFALAVCNLESGLGESQANSNNFFGFTYDGYMSFDTPEEGILYFGKLISGSIYSGKSIDEISKIYCPPNPRWAPDVRWLMEHHWNKVS